MIYLLLSLILIISAPAIIVLVIISNVNMKIERELREDRESKLIGGVK